MALELRMPALGQTSDELEVVRWLKSEGERVARGEPLLEVQTDKATLEVEAAEAGTLLKLLCAEGDRVEAGAAIAWVGAAGEVVPTATTASAAPGGTAGATPAAAAPAPGSAPRGAAPADAEAHAPGQARVFASPAVRALARERGVDLARVRGTGPGGRIEKGDVEALAAAGSVSSAAATAPTPAAGAATPGAEPVAPPAAAANSSAGKVLASPAAQALARERGTGPGGRIEPADIEAAAAAKAASAPSGVAAPSAGAGAGFTDDPVPRRRQVLARRLAQSAAIPQIQLTATVDATRAAALLRAQCEAGLEGLTWTHLILRAVAAALRAHPGLNRVWLDDPPRYRSFARADVGLAVAGDDNLLLVTVAEPDARPLAELVGAVGAAVERARQGTLSQADVAPAALTVSNLGMFGVDEFRALVDPAQAAILAVGRVAEAPLVVAGQLRAVPQLRLSLSVDHRVADGVPAAQFLSAIRHALEGED